MRWLQAAGHMQCFESSYWCPLIQFKVQILGEARVCPEPPSTRTTSCTVTTVAPLNIYALIYFWLCWVFAAVRAVLQFRPVGLLSGCGVHGLLLAAASLVVEHGPQVCGLQQLRLPGSRAQAKQLQYTSLVAPRHVGSSSIRDGTQVS